MGDTERHIVRYAPLTQKRYREKQILSVETGVGIARGVNWNDLIDLKNLPLVQPEPAVQGDHLHGELFAVNHNAVHRDGGMTVWGRWRQFCRMGR